MTAKLLETRELSTGHGDVEVVRKLDLRVAQGEIVALLGPNGAGKTTTMLTLAGELPALGGDVWMLGRPAVGPLHSRARQGLSLVTEERSVFMELTVRQNIEVGSVEISRVVELFPELEPLMKRRVRLLSGGEQQMLALARALARDPSLLLADELSLGLAPKSVDRLLLAVRQAADARGMGALLVEQHVHRVLSIADRVVVLARGAAKYAGTAAEAKKDMHKIRSHYLSHSTADTTEEEI